jgi:hypothetical protein
VQFRREIARFVCLRHCNAENIEQRRLLIYALKSKLFTAGSSAEKRGFRSTHAVSRRIDLTADVD